jgi:hypothetical protein
MMPPNVDNVTGLGQNLPENVAPARAERLAQADFPRPFGHRHQHDVHDDDAADHQREADDADENREDALRNLIVEIEKRVRRRDAEIVRVARPQPPLNPHRDFSVIHGGPGHRGVCRCHREVERLARAENLLKRAERHDRVLVLRLAENRPFLFRDADRHGNARPRV